MAVSRSGFKALLNSTRRRLSFSAAITGLILSVSLADIHASAATNPAPPDSNSAATVGTAKAVARAHGHKVEISGLGSDTTTTFANPDGSYTATVSSVRSRWKDASSQWHDIDLTMVPQADGTIAPKSDDPSRGLRFPARADGPVTFSTPAGAFRVTHPAVTAAVASAAAQVAPRVTTPATVALAASPRAGGGRGFESVMNGRGLSEQATVDGFEESVTLASAAQGGSYVDEVATPPGVVAKQTDAGVEFDDASGAAVVAVGGGEAHDSAPDTSGMGVTSPVTATLISQAGGVVDVRIQTSDAWLQDSARVFPVVIDPSFYMDTSANGSGSIDTYIEQDDKGPWAAGGDPSLLRVGRQPSGSIARTMIYWNLQGIPTHGVTVSSSTFAFVDALSNSCTPYNVKVSALTGAFVRHTLWNSAPGIDPSTTQYSAPFAHNGVGNGCDQQFEYAPVDQMVQRWLTTNNGPQLPNYGLRIENDSREWTALGSGESGGGWAPQITINYQSTNSAPTLTSTYCANCTSTDAPTFYANAADADGDPISYTFQVWGPASKLEAQATAAGAAGQWVGYQMPPNILRTGTVYSWTVSYSDPWSSGAAATNYFTLGGAPAQPAQNVTVTPPGTSGNASVYWAEPVDDGGAAVQVWRVSATMVGTTSTVTLDTTGNATGITLTGLYGSALYFYTVTGWSANGWTSPAHPAAKPGWTSSLTAGAAVTPPAPGDNSGTGYSGTAQATGTLYLANGSSASGFPMSLVYDNAATMTTDVLASTTTGGTEAGRPR
jgi:large repetitive protein